MFVQSVMKIPTRVSELLRDKISNIQIFKGHNFVINVGRVMVFVHCSLSDHA